MERVVGWFVLLALALLLFGFGYYLYTTAERKGWFKTKAPYFTFTERATGLRVGDPVQLMGFDVGQITHIDAQPPFDPYNVYVEFEVKSPYYGYLWTGGSRAKVNTADLLGKRVIEVTKGVEGYPTYVFYPLHEVSLDQARALPDLPKWLLGEEILEPQGTNVLARALTPLTNLAALAAAGHTRIVALDSREERKSMTGIWLDREGRYAPYTRKSKPYWLLSEESPAVSERLEQLVGSVEKALPNILSLTNQLAQVLSNSASLTSNLNVVAVGAQPVVSNLATLTAQLDHPGALGDLLLPTNLNQKLDFTLGNAGATMAAANTNLTILAQQLSRSLENLASITSNLNAQVEANTNVLSSISEAIQHTDQFVQGLKRHWLLRSAFREKTTNAPPTAPAQPLRSPKDPGSR